MRVELSNDHKFRPIVRIICGNAYSPWALTIPQARDLYTQLTPILEQVANEEREDVTD